MRFFICLLLSFSLTQCITYDFSRRIVQQGNLLPQPKIELLHIGMSKQETAILMGTSLINPMFNNNRWDYAYTYRRGSGPLEIRRLSIDFHGDRIAKIINQP